MSQRYKDARIWRRARDVAMTAPPARPDGTTTAPRPRPPLIGLACATLVLIALLGRVAIAGHGARAGLLYVLGIAFGFTLYQTRFGFSSVFRQLGRDRHGQGVYAHLLMLAVASLLFAPLLASTHPVFGLQPHGFVYPLSAGVVGGAFLFGVGVQLGGACTAGTLYDIGGGYVAMLLTLVGFAGGAVLGAWHWRFWTHDLPSLPPVSLAQSPWGYGGALLVQLAALGLVAVVRARTTRRDPTTPGRPPRTPHTPRRLRSMRNPWPLWVGAVLLAVLNALTLLVKGAPWGITAARSRGLSLPPPWASPSLPGPTGPGRARRRCARRCWPMPRR